MKRAVLAMVLVLAAAAAAAGATGPDRLSNPQLEARAVALQKQFRCPQCQGESLDESGAPLAADLRRLIRARILAGQSDAQIRTYLVSRYGDFILMKPPLDAATLWLWFGPVLVLLGGAAAVAAIVVRARPKPSDEKAKRSSVSDI